MNDLPDYLRDAIPDGWQFSMWPWMQEQDDGTLSEEGVYYRVCTTCEGRRIGFTALVDNLVRKEPWFLQYERELIQTMVKNVRMARGGQ